MAPAASPAAPPESSGATPAQAAAQRAEPGSTTRVIEDDKVRIEETRLRGQLRRVTVHSKLTGGSAYEITVGSGGRDPSQSQGRNPAGQSAWSLFSF